MFSSDDFLGFFLILGNILDTHNLRSMDENAGTEDLNKGNVNKEIKKLKKNTMLHGIKNVSCSQTLYPSW